MTIIRSFVSCWLVAAAVCGSTRTSAQTLEATPQAQSPSDSDSNGTASETNNALRLKQGA